MPRPKRITLGGYVYHVLNRANGRQRIFHRSDDFSAFESILALGAERFHMRICGYCIMGNHWHLLLWPHEDGDLTRFMHWATLTHTQRYHTAHGTAGIGHLYQGRYKSFPVQNEAYYLTALRYIEANPLRAGLVETAEQWPWSSYTNRQGSESTISLSEGPVSVPDDWKSLVNQPIAKHDQSRMRNCMVRGAPLGDEQWVKQTASIMDLELTLHARGRPRKGS